MRRKSDWVSVKSELRKGIIVVIITRRHFEMQDGCCHPFRVTTGSDGRAAGMWVRFKSVKWFAEGGDGCDQRKALYHAGDEKQIEQIDKGSRIRGGGQLRGPAEKRNPEHRGCVEDRDMTAETKIALCGHTAHFHFMSQYPIYTHTYTHPYSHIFALFRRHYTLTQMRIKTQICTHKQKHTPVLIYSHTYFHHIVFFFPFPLPRSYPHELITKISNILNDFNLNSLNFSGPKCFRVFTLPCHYYLACMPRKLIQAKTQRLTHADICSFT